MELKIGDKVFGLVFTMGTLEQLKIVTQKDPFDFTNVSADPWVISDMGKVIFIAAHKAWCDYYDRPCEYTDEQLVKEFKKLDGKEASRLLKAYTNAYKADEEPVSQGEASRPMHK